MKNKVYCVPIWEATWTFQDKKVYFTLKTGFS